MKYQGFKEWIKTTADLGTIIKTKRNWRDSRIKVIKRLKNFGD